jgi:hypothetical protein
MCTVSTVIDGWRDHTWPMPQYPGNPQTLPVYPFIPAPEQPPHTNPLVPGPNAIPWPQIVADPKLAQQMLDILAKLEAIDKRLGQLESCKVSAVEKKKLKAKLRRIAKRGSRP